MPEEKKNISIVVVNGQQYEIKDAWAREAIEGLGNPTHFLGETTSTIVDGQDLNPIIINGESVTAVAGDIVVHSNAEFIYSGNAWIELGDLSGLGALAYKDNASGSYTPAGTVSQPNFVGNEMTASGKFTPEGDVTLSGGTAQTVVASVGKESATVKVLNEAGSVTAGSASEFEQGTDSFTQGEDQFSAGSLPAWSKEADTFSGGTAAAWSAAVDDSTETLSFSWTPNTVASYTEGTATWSAGTLPSYTQGVDSFTQGSDSFTPNVPTTVVLDSFKDQAVVTEVTSTDGSVTVPTTATFSGTEGDISAKGTPAGTVSQPTFSGTQDTVTVS